MKATVALAVLIAVVTPSFAAKRRRISAKPVSVVFVLDRSGSMQGTKLAAAKAAVRSAVDQLRGCDRVSLVVFDSEAETVFSQLGKRDRIRIGELVDDLASGGGTHIVPALEQARGILGKTKVRQHIVLLSDGQAPTDGLFDLVAAMRADGTTISTYALDGADLPMLRRIASDGGGRFRDLTDPSGLAGEVAQELDGIGTGAERCR